jgi:hypothetical protein
MAQVKRNLGKHLVLAAGYAGMEIGEPEAPPANNYVIYAIDNGSGKTKLMVKFSSGAVQQIAIQP